MRRPASVLVAIAVSGLGLGCGGDADGGPVTVTANCAAIESWTFPETQLGQRSSVILMFQGTGSGTGHGMTVAVTGASADQFSIAPGDTDCDDGAFGPNRFCLMRVDFAPTELGSATAALEVMGVEVPLSGDAIAETTTGIFAEVANLSYVGGAYGIGVTSFYVSNQTASEVALDPLAVTADGFAMTTASDCPTALPAGAACTVYLSQQPTIRGCASGSLTLPTSAGPVELPIASTFVGGAQVSVRGPGAGAVTSSPAGLDCAVTGVDSNEAAICATAFPGVDEVTLTATPATGHFFNGWLYGQGCDAAYPTCTLRMEPARYQPTAFARFATPAAKRIAVTIEGDAVGWVDAIDARCGASCSLYAEPGQTMFLRPHSPSRFLGWAGACTGTTRGCELGLIVNDRELTATFARDDAELVTLLPSVPTNAGGVLAGGDLVVGGTDVGLPDTFPIVVSRLSPAGEVMWTRVLDDTSRANSSDLLATTDDEIYVFVIHSTGDSTVTKLTGDGAVVWTQEVAAAAMQPRPLLDLLVDAGSNLVVLGPSGLVALSKADGTEQWRVEDLGVVRAAAGLSSGGVVVARSTAIAGEIELLRFTADGDPVAATWTASGVGSVALATDSLDRLVIVDDTGVVRLAADGTTDFTTPIDPGFGAVNGGGVAVAGDDTIVIARAHAVGVFPIESAGLGLEVYDAAGTRVWTVDKPPYLEGDLISAGTDAVIATDVGIDAGGRIAVIGGYLSRPWAELFDP